MQSESRQSASLASILACVLLGVFLPCSELNAGFIAAAGVHGISSSFRPIEDGDTPNYAGSSLLMQLGYSFGDWLELSFDSDYSQMDKGKTSLLAGDVRLLVYGICLATQLGETALFGISYQQSRFSWPLDDDAQTDAKLGRWRGSLLGLRVGGLIGVNNGWAFQLAMQYRSGRLRQQNFSGLSSDAEERTVDTFALGVTYLFQAPSRQLWWSFY